MQLPWPTFADRFLARTLLAVARRRRALGRMGEFEARFAAPGEPPWFAISLEVAARRTVTLHLAPGAHAWLRVTSTWSRDRGKVLLDLDDLRLAADADHIVGAFEATVAEVGSGRAPALFAGPVTELWRALELHLVAVAPSGEPR